MKGAVALQIELELGNRCKFNVAVLKKYKSGFEVVFRAW